MASIWSIGSVDIYVTGRQNQSDVKMAKITVLDADGSSNLHFFGSGAREITVRGWLFSESNKTTLENYAEDNTSVTLTTDSGSAGSFKIQDLKLDQYGPFVKLSVPGYAEDDTIYNVNCKLIKV